MAIFGFLVAVILGFLVVGWTAVMAYVCVSFGSDKDIIFLTIPLCIGCALLAIAWHFCPFMVVIL